MNCTGLHKRQNDSPSGANSQSIITIRCQSSKFLDLMFSIWGRNKSLMYPPWSMYICISMSITTAPLPYILYVNNRMLLLISRERYIKVILCELLSKALRVTKNSLECMKNAVIYKIMLHMTNSRHLIIFILKICLILVYMLHEKSIKITFTK